MVVVTKLSFTAYGALPLQLKNDSTEVKTAIRRVYLDRESAFLHGDSALFLKCYADDGAMMPPGLPLISGTKGLLTFFKTARNAGVRNIIVAPVALYGLTDQFVTEQGRYEMLDGDNNSMGKGKYLVLWKKTPAGWKIFRDMFSDDLKSALGRE